MTEARYQAYLIRRIYDILPPDTVIMKTDPQYRQGFPDLLILCGRFWAALEVKISERASRRPNQEFHIAQLDEMSFAAFICPENEEEVLSALQQAFKHPRRARVS